MTEAPSKRLTVCCMSGGRQPERLASILALFAPVADEIVVAVEEPRVLETHAAVSRVADRVLSFPPTHPSDRPIAWLFGECSGRWILNIDDDEIPSPRLIDALPGLVAREDITHAWIARRWLYPDVAHHLDEAPWSTEFQLRLLLADPRFIQFSDVFHLPIVAHGPGAYVNEPLWHLDTAVNEPARRRAKAEAYELERPGMRISGRTHNHALYVPELTPDPSIAPVPCDDLAQIHRVLEGGAPPARDVSAPLVYAASADVDALWPGAPFGETLHCGRIVAHAMPSAMRAGVQETIDVSVTNGGGGVWRWGNSARPNIRLAYRWTQDGEPVHEPIALRTVLPADLRPGETQVVPLHVVPPQAPGAYGLALELVHDGVVAFAATPVVELQVLEREQIALVGDPRPVLRLLARLSAPPYVEPVIVLGNESDRAGFGDHICVPGLRAPLLSGLEHSGRISRLLRLSWRSYSLVRRARRYRRSGETGNTRLDGLFDKLTHARGLFVASTDWPEDAAAGREWWRLVTTLRVGHAAGCPVYVADDAVPAGSRLRDRVFRRVIRRCSTPIGDMTLRHPDAATDTAAEPEVSETLTGALV